MHGLAIVMRQMGRPNEAIPLLREILQLTRERDKLEKTLGGIKDMKKLPDAMFVIDVGHEDIAVKEARKLGIPVIAVVDTNCSPNDVDYVIPGNDLLRFTQDPSQGPHVHPNHPIHVRDDHIEAAPGSRGAAAFDRPQAAPPGCLPR